MANKNKKTEEKRSVGRPAAMPGETMRNHMVRVAEDVPDLIGELAKARGVSRGQLVTTLVRNAAERRRKDAARRAAKEETAAS